MKNKVDYLIWLSVILLALASVMTMAYAVKAEDCYIWPPKYYSTELYPTVEERRYRPRQRLNRQLKRVKRKENANLIYFVSPKSKTVRATYGTLGYDRTWGIGPKGYQYVALKIAQGWEADDFGTWVESILEEEHRRAMYEIHCEQRNWCRERYVRDKPQLTLCFVDLKLWPSERKLYVGNGTIVSFKDIEEVKIR